MSHCWPVLAVVGRCFSVVLASFCVVEAICLNRRRFRLLMVLHESIVINDGTSGFEYIIGNANVPPLAARWLFSYACRNAL